MKRILTLLICSMVAANSFAVVAVNTENQEAQAQIQEFGDEFQNMSVEDFLALTPRKYKKMTGEKLGIMNSIKLKAAQKFMKKKSKKAGADISQGLYVVLAIIGLGWLAMGLLDDWSGNNWIFGLILSLLFWLPGVIFSLIKMNEYY